jgi:hypothetical protein
MISTMRVVKPVPLDRALNEVAAEMTWRCPDLGERAWSAMRRWSTVVLTPESAQQIQDLLADANGWRGPDARRIKKELRGALAHFEQQIGRQWDEERAS